jgi:hypothetical protein
VEVGDQVKTPLGLGIVQGFIRKSGKITGILVKIGFLKGGPELPPEFMSILFSFGPQEVLCSKH